MQYNIPVDAVFTAQHSATGASFSYLDKANIQLSAQLMRRLNNNELIAYSVGEHTYYLREHDTKTYVQWGPIPTKLEPVNDNYLILFFYSALAIIFLVLMWPMFRDLAFLQRCALQFGENQQTQPLTISKKSTVYPLAHALYTMSNRLVEFVSLQKDVAKIIAHEVRTPLARMKFVLKRIEGNIEDKHLSRMLMDVAELETLATDYMVFSSSQQVDPQYLQSISVKSLLTNLADKYQHLHTGVDIVYHQQDTQINANKAQLELALSNLLNNALRYARQKVSVSVDVEPENVTFHIDDDGPGFDANKPRVNNQGTTTGFGLGLYIVESIVNRHHGKLTKSAASLGGARVSVSIPRLCPTADALS
ncbi:ATP-binding protein [Thalassotalea ponticola]|uniref:ATP-binding protein n=1 Tax=Thalassotalea ponticola TaxID=1523392 RepID=UPI0025B29E86|nr:ATP-binding protein [Thalassotalea ponticola]MDN3651842.1 ATP-binding protein [Thalassotalea ponticola]